MAEAIVQAADLYQDEFLRVKHTAMNIWNMDETRFFGHYKQYEDGRLARMRHGIARARAVLRRSERPIRPNELTFEEFAFAKAIAQRYLARRLLKSTIANEGYVNTDMDGYALRVVAKPGEKPVLDVTLFDFERYDKANKWGIEQGQSDTVDIDFASRVGGLFIVSDVEGVRSIRAAAVFALLQEAGMPLKSQP